MLSENALSRPYNWLHSTCMAQKGLQSTQQAPASTRNPEILHCFKFALKNYEHNSGQGLS